MGWVEAGVVGCGYVGLVAAASLCSVGLRVVAVEVDPERRALLRDGRVPFHEPGLEALLRDGLQSGRLVLADDVAAVAGCGAVFVAVPTPDDPADPASGALDRVIDALRATLSAPTVLVIKSTVTPAAVDALLARLSDTPVSVVVNPEFLREGHAVADFRRPARLVLGGPPGAVAHVLSLYAPLYGDEVPIVRTDARTAALAKLASNGMLAVRVSFANELGRVAAALGVDFGHVLEVLGSDPRIGPSHLGPSVGYGGACLPKDTRMLAAVGRSLGLPLRVVEATDRANIEQQAHVVALVRTALGGLAGRRVAVWGLAFKAGTDDVRDSAPLAVVRALRDAGAEVAVHDPMRAPGDPLALLDEAEVLVVGTAWPAYAAIDPRGLRPGIAVDPGRVLDGRWAGKGWKVLR